MKYNLKNKTALITGAPGGIGREICKKFLENECVLICTSCRLRRGSIFLSEKFKLSK